MRPASITMFDRLYLGGLALGLVNFVVSYDTTMAQIAADPALSTFGGLPFLLGTMAISYTISLLFWYFIARRASNVAKWILVVLTAIGALSLPLSLTQMGTAQLILTLVVFGMQVVAVWFLFRPDAKAWFTPGAQGMDPTVFD